MVHMLRSQHVFVFISNRGNLQYVDAGRILSLPKSPRHRMRFEFRRRIKSASVTFILRPFFIFHRQAEANRLHACHLTGLFYRHGILFTTGATASTSRRANFIRVSTITLTHLNYHTNGHRDQDLPLRNIHFTDT